MLVPLTCDPVLRPNYAFSPDKVEAGDFAVNGDGELFARHCHSFLLVPQKAKGYKLDDFSGNYRVTFGKSRH